MNGQTKQALAHIAQALNDFANTLPASAKGPFIAATNQAVKQIESELPKDSEKA